MRDELFYMREGAVAARADALNEDEDPAEEERGSVDSDGNDFDVDEMERQDILDRAAEGLSDAELQDELDRARAPLPIVEPPVDNWRERLHDHWIEADRRMDAEIRRGEAGYLGGDH